MKLVSFAVVLFLGACSSSDDVTGADFIGNWSTTTGVQTVSDCSFYATKPNLAITYTVTKGNGADLTLQSSAGPFCPLKANVVDKRALVVTGQTCERTDGSYKDTYTYSTTSVMDLSGGTPTIKLDATFRRFLNGTDTGYTCGYTEESPLKKGN